MPIIQQGQLNTTALTVPNDYIQIVPPNNIFINGSPTNILGLVGIASWGPVNSPTTVGSTAQYNQLFGPIQNLKYDIGTHVAAAALQGANNFKIVRVTDGTDTAADALLLDTAESPATGLTVTALYTGTLGNTLSITLGQGSSYTTSVKTYRITIALPGGIPEIFDNIGGTGATFWANAASAINNGQNIYRGASQLVTAAIASSTTAPALATYAFTGGDSGVATITGAVLIGSDTVPREGMYALRNTYSSVVDLCDCDTDTTWSAQVAYGLSEGSYMILVGPAGESIATAATAIQTEGINSYAAKLLLGDWCYWADPTNKITRLISPQGFVAGLRATLSPQISTLNKQLYGILGTQTTYSNQTYSAADLQALALARIDVITNPCVGGNYFGVRFGRNTSSDQTIWDDTYTDLTNYFAATLDVNMNQFVGLPQTTTVQLQAQNSIEAFLQQNVSQGIIGNIFGGPAFSVVINSTNNPQNQVALGYMQADIQIVYFQTIQYFVANVQGGAGVTITNLGAQPLNQNP